MCFSGVPIAKLFAGATGASLAPFRFAAIFFTTASGGRHYVSPISYQVFRGETNAYFLQLFFEASLTHDFTTVLAVSLSPLFSSRVGATLTFFLPWF